MTQHILTTINVQGDNQEVYEVYSNESKEQTIAFCFTEEQAQLIASAQELLTLCKRAHDTIAFYGIEYDFTPGKVQDDLEAAIENVTQ